MTAWNRTAQGRMWMLACGAGLSLACDVRAGAEAWWLFDIRYSDPAGVINSPDDTATVELWAGFNPKAYAFEGGWLDITTDDPMDRGEWSELDAILEGPGWKDGVIDGERANDIRVGQLHALGGYYADTSNPILAWQATWTTIDVTRRNVDVVTLTSRFGVYADFAGNWKDLTSDVREGAARIRVVPCPAVSVGWLGIALLAGQRKRTPPPRMRAVDGHQA